VKASHLWVSKYTNNGQVADKMHATFSYFLTSNPVPETKGRNLSQLHSLQKFSQYNAIEKNWMNEDRYRKDPRNQIIISTETNDKPQ
jgi:hypothetical protein